MDLTLLCWVRGDDVEDVFTVEILREATVGTLKRALKNEKSATFRDVDANTLKIYRLFVPSGADRGVELGRWRVHGKRPLDPDQQLSELFPKSRDGRWVVVVNYPTARVQFRVYFRNVTVLVSAMAHDTVEDFLPGCLRDRQDVFGNISPSKIKVYRLNPPVLDTEKGKYLDNWEPMEGTDLVELSFGESTVTRRHVCMAFILVEDVSSRAINALERRYTRIFSSLKITVAKPLKWTMNDVENNLGGGRYTEGGRSNVGEIEEIQDLLGSLRLYDEVMQESRDFDVAQEYGEDDGLFDKIFETLSGNEGTRLKVHNKREFTTFYNILRCWQEDAGKVRDQKSSAVKAGNFAAYFIQPPFFCDGGSDVKYETEMPWGFPIFVGTRGALDVWRKYRPKSDLMVSSQGHLIPFFVSEVISMKSEDDRFRMLLQAIAAARAGKILLKKTAERKFFVVAVYLNKNMIASRYIVMQTGQDNAEPTEEFRQGNAVSIHCNDFDLTDSAEATEFAREMYNLVGELNDLADDLDGNTARTLKQIVDAAKDVLSLHSKTYPVQRTQASRLDSIPEQGAGEEPHEDMEGGEEDELGIFGAHDVQEHLSSMNSMVDFRVFGHENLAVVRRKTDDSVGYLKFVETTQKREVKILQFLGGIQSPKNHTISGVGFWPVQGGTMISMPVAGARLTSLERPDEHLWSAASQLVEGVAFMHAQLVAHMDIKPENIIIPPQGGRLSIIDFSSSILLKREKQKFRGIAGTAGYIAPEVERGDAYQPVQADLWSCGRTLEVLCSICKPSTDRDFLLGVAAELTSEDPDRRPGMSKVQEWIVSRMGDVGAETYTLQSPRLVVCA